MRLRIDRRQVMWTLCGIVALAVSYTALAGVVLAAMLQPPTQFGQFMTHMPTALVWRALPASRMWLWAREGDLAPGDLAPDFALVKHGGDGRERMTLSSYRARRPVVLVFGSYT